MFSSISWQQFFTALTVLLFVYYFLVIAVYYGKDLVLLSKKQHPVIATRAEPTNGNDDNSLLFSAVHDLMEELKSVFHSAAKNDYPKEELLMALEVKLRDYPKLKGTPFQVSINKHMIQESREKCATILTENDIRNLW
jgi:cellulose synthase/poly-beta-1,6-N-acetylglucosamine synthase-like glycosyltransferase